MFLGYIILQLFCSYSYGTRNVISHTDYFVLLRTLRSKRAVPSMAVVYSSLISCLPDILLRFIIIIIITLLLLLSFSINYISLIWKNLLPSRYTLLITSTSSRKTSKFLHRFMYLIHCS